VQNKKFYVKPFDFEGKIWYNKKGLRKNVKKE